MVFFFSSSFPLSFLCTFVHNSSGCEQHWKCFSECIPSGQNILCYLSLLKNRNNEFYLVFYMYVFSTLSMIHLKNVGIFQNYRVWQFEDKVSLSLFFLKKESTKFYVNVISQKLSFIFSESSLNNYVPPPLKSFILMSKTASFKLWRRLSFFRFNFLLSWQYQFVVACFLYILSCFTSCLL